MKRKRPEPKRKKVWGKAEVRKRTVASSEEFRKLIPPAAVDSGVRQALQVCWMLLPESSKNVAELEKEFRRVVDRALLEFRQDAGRA
jgi:hypothetical protein